MSCILLWLRGGCCIYDSHHDIHKDNVFLQTAHSYAAVKKVDDCWVCGLMPHAVNVYPYIAIPFTVREYATAFRSVHSALFNPNVTFFLQKVDRVIPGTSHRLTLSYAPKGFLCVINAGTGEHVGTSVCEFVVRVGQRKVDITWPGGSEMLPLPDWSTDGLAAYNGTMFVCGKFAYTFLPPSWQGTCYLAYVVPAVRMTKEPPKVSVSSRPKRDLFGNHIAVATPTQRFFSAVVPTYGMTVALDEIRDLSGVVQRIANDSASAIQELNVELRAVRAMCLQTRLALDIVLASKGGTCAIIDQECCTFVPDKSHDVEHYVSDIYSKVAKLKSDSQAWSLEDWITSWGGALAAKIFQIVIPSLLCLLAIGVSIQCFCCLTKRICCKARLARVGQAKYEGGDRVEIPEPRIPDDYFV